KSEAAVLSVWPLQSVALANGASLATTNGIVAAAESAMSELKTRADYRGFCAVKGRNEYRLKSASLRDLALELGMQQGSKKMTDKFEATSSAFHAGFLRGMFDSDGSVQGNQKKGVSIRLTQVDKAALQRIQRMLLRMG